MPNFWPVNQWWDQYTTSATTNAVYWPTTVHVQGGSAATPPAPKDEGPLAWLRAAVEEVTALATA